MPQALVFLAPATFGVGGSIALVTATGALTGLGIAASIGGSLLLSAASTALARSRAPTVEPENIKLNIRQAVGDRIVHVGRVRVGGTIVFFRTKSGVFYRVIVHGHGEIDGIEAYYLDGKQVTVDAEGYVTDERYLTELSALGVIAGTSLQPLIRIRTRLGGDIPGVYAPIEAQWPIWDEDHTLNGLWTSLTIAESTDAERFREVYPNGEPPIEMIARGTQVRDPRDDSTGWKDNAALIIGGLLEGAAGFGLTGYVDDDMLAEAADDCDVSFALAATGTEPAYRIWGSYSLMERPADVLQRMLDACAGDVRLLPSGKIGITVGKNRIPDVTLARSELISIDSWTNGPDVLDRYTEAAFKYLDPGLAYQPNTGGMWIDAAREAENGEAATGPEFDYLYAPSSTQGDRLIQQQIERDNPAHIITTRWKPSARRAIYEDVVALDVAELPDAVWRVVAYSRDFNSGIVTLTLHSYAHPTWSNTFEGIPQALPEPDEDREVPVPTNVTAAGAGVRGAQNTYVAAIGAQWDPRPSQALSIKCEYSSAGDDDWQSWPLGAGESSTQIAPLDDGADYDLRFWYQTAGDKKSAYVVLEDITALADASAPAAPTGLTVTDQTGGSALVQFTTSTSPGLWKTEVRRDGALIATSFANPETAVSIADAPGAGSFTWTARSINVSAVANTTDETATQTIT